MKVLWVGDACCQSGFAKNTHEVCDVLVKGMNVAVLGLNYRGDPHPYAYPIYTAMPGGDYLGVARLPYVCDKERPDVIVLQNDPWQMPGYLDMLRKAEIDVPVVGNITVDGKNCRGTALHGWTSELRKSGKTPKGLDHAVFATNFGMDEAQKGGWKGPSSVIPLGVDLKIYRPMNRLDAREARNLPEPYKSGFMVGNVNRNQLRKRLDLTIQYFAEWVREKSVKDAFLYLHTAPTGDGVLDVQQFASYHGILDRLICMEPEMFQGLSEEEMRHTYNCFDVQLTTSQGESFGLPSFEGAACNAVQVAGNWSGHGELLGRENAGVLIPCDNQISAWDGVNNIGAVPNKKETIQALDALYNNEMLMIRHREAGRRLVEHSDFRWENIGKKFAELLSSVVEQYKEKAA